MQIKTIFKSDILALNLPMIMIITIFIQNIITAEIRSPANAGDMPNHIPNAVGKSGKTIMGMVGNVIMGVVVGEIVVVVVVVGGSQPITNG